MRAEDRLRSFIELYSPKLQDPYNLEELCDALDESLHKPVFLLVEAPPRHYKTVTLLHHIARLLKKRPSSRCAYSSYAGALAFRKSKICRDVAQRAGIFAPKAGKRSKFGEAGFGRRFDPASAVSYWETPEGGGLVAGGRKGAFVGEGFDFILIDDPFKDRSEADSDKIQDMVYEDLFQGTMFTRLEPNASIVVTHQPWNDRDLIARLIDWAETEGLKHVRRISLPAVRDAVYDQRDRLIGGKPLLPHRYDIPALRKIQVTIGPYNFESQYQCNRVPKGKRAFTEPEKYAKARIDHTITAISCDPGIDEDSKTDPSGYVIGRGYLDDEGSVCIDILLAEEHDEEIPETVDRLEEYHREHDRAPIVLEEVSAFKAVSQIARRLDQERVRRREQPANLQIISWTPKASKFVRALPTAAAVKYGRIRVPQSAPWLPAFLLQLRRFTGRPGGKDNMVDALSQLYDWFEKRLARAQSKPRTGGAREVAAGAY